ncbi:MAG TPA: MFS transporter [bacterium]|nr:MFS transporter [bacterium]HPQ65562.1 MFS transporter [bacterium]
MKTNDNGQENGFRWGTIFRSLGYRNYRLFFTGQSVSLIGTWMQRVAIPWLVYSMSGSPVLLGVVSFAGQVPTFLLAPVAGVLVDRWDRYRVLIATQVLAMLQAAALACLYYLGTIQVWEIVSLAAVLGVINAFDMPARQALVVDLVEKRQNLGNAIALNSSMVNSARLLGPSLAGALIASVGEGVCFVVNAISFLCVIVSLLLMKLPRTRAASRERSLLKGLRGGLAYAFGFPPVRAIILLLGVISLTGMPYMVLMPVFAKSVLGGGPYTFGLLMAASGVGALTGALWLASRKSVLGLGRLIPRAAGLFGSSLVAFSFSRSFPLSLGLIFLAGLGMMVQMASGNTIIQTLVDDDKRGRVMSLYMMAFVGTAPFGSLAAGALADAVGAPATLALGGSACVLGALVFLRRLPALRRHVRPVYVRLGIIPEVASGIQASSECMIPPER